MKARDLFGGEKAVATVGHKSRLYVAGRRGVVFHGDVIVEFVAADGHAPPNERFYIFAHERRPGQTHREKDLIDVEPRRLQCRNRREALAERFAGEKNGGLEFGEPAL